MAGQSINDRLTAARYAIAGQGLAKSVCKATTEEVIGPKKKHLDYLIHCTNEPNVSIPQLANLLIERSQMQSWVVVFKALITVHHLMCYGNERFTQYLASSNCNFNLGGFLDKTGNAAQSYDMSTFIRRYAKYINEKAISYRTVAVDFCKVKRGKEDGILRSMPTDNLLKTLPVLQAQLDALLEFDCSASELNNGVISSGFLLLFRDLIRLFACYNDGIINLLEKYFEMNKKQARDALDCYKKFLIRMDRVSEFLKVAETIGMDKSEIPDLKQAPSSLLDALEAHLNSLEGKKSSTTVSASSTNFKSAVSALNSTSTSFGNASSNGRAGESSVNSDVDELTKRAALAEEEAMYEKIKAEHSKNNPFLSSPAEGAAAGPPSTNGEQGHQIIDLFGSGGTESGSAKTSESTRASDDLLQLAGNPFSDMMTAPGAPQQPYTNGFVSASHLTHGSGLAAGHSSGFVSDNTFAAVFGNTSAQQTQGSNVNPFFIPAFDGFGDILKPEGTAEGTVPTGILSHGGGVPSNIPSTTGQPVKLITGDLDMSLSSLVDNLNMKSGSTGKNQWNSPKTQSKTGGAGWSPAIAPTVGIRPQMGMAGAPTQGVPLQAAQFPSGGMVSFPQQQPVVGGMQVMGSASSGQPSAAPASQGSGQTTFDPFGAM